MPPTAVRPRVRNALGLVAAACLVAGPAIAHAKLVPALAGFGLFALGGLVALLVAIASVVQALRGRGLGAGGAVCLVAAIAFVAAASRGFGVPGINDFTTDLADPPAFREAAAIPANAGRDLSYPAAFADIQRACCSDLLPAHLAAAPDVAFGRARAAAESMPAWTVTAADPGTGHLEAVATTRVFGFQDDVVVRVRPDPAGGSRVDMRSKSRDGKGDIGANVARIRAFLAALERR
jgi:uncharacterized protein (DUF1499 family)